MVWVVPFLSMLLVGGSAHAEPPPFYEVSGAPDACSASYVFPRSAPMMAEGYGQPWTLEPATLEGISWGACSRMVPHDGSRPVWVVTIWEPAFRGNLFCSSEGRILGGPRGRRSPRRRRMPT